jgi:hypothetical protein
LQLPLRHSFGSGEYPGIIVDIEEHVRQKL